MIHVVLLSCERRDYTLRTLQTFQQCNTAASVDVSTLADAEPKTVGGKIDAGFTLWHCDDASTDPKLRRQVQAAGWRELIYTDRRVGVTEMIRRASRKLEHAGAEWMLLLENDWETARRFPWAIFDLVRERGDVWALRLYGQFKERDQQLPAGARHRGRSGADPRWLDFAVAGWPIEPANCYQVGDIHWGNPPSVAKVPLVAWLHKNASREKDAIVRSGQITDHVARVVENVVYHIGAERTPGFMS